MHKYLEEVQKRTIPISGQYANKFMDKLSHDYNHNLTEKVLLKANEEENEKWYKEELVKSNTEFINWLTER